MSRNKKKYITAACTFSVALGIGFVMQYGDAVASRWGADRPVAGPGDSADAMPLEILPVSASVAVPTNFALPNAIGQRDEIIKAVAVIPEDIDTPRFDDPAPVPLPVAADAATDLDAVEMVEEDPIELVTVCDIALTATPAPMAMVTLALSSPCRAEQIVTLHHHGMMFNAITDAAGEMVVVVPALDTEPFFIAAFDDGEGAVAITGVPEMAMYDRAVLQWQGTSDAQLHALEYGAAYGEPGHVWAQAASAEAQAITGEGGFLTQLGDPSLPNPLMAEIYTFPSGIAARDGAVELSVEVEVTSRNCGREVVAQSLQMGASVQQDMLDLAMTMPDCSAIGEYLVLKNMFEDLTLAAK